jgi:hypothetical protein
MSLNLTCYQDIAQYIKKEVSMRSLSVPGRSLTAFSSTAARALRGTALSAATLVASLPTV